MFPNEPGELMRSSRKFKHIPPLIVGVLLRTPFFIWEEDILELVRITDSNNNFPTITTKKWPKYTQKKIQQEGEAGPTG